MLLIPIILKYNCKFYYIYFLCFVNKFQLACNFFITGLLSLHFLEDRATFLFCLFLLLVVLSGAVLLVLPTFPLFARVAVEDFFWGGPLPEFFSAGVFVFRDFFLLESLTISAIAACKASCSFTACKTNICCSKYTQTFLELFHIFA